VEPEQRSEIIQTEVFGPVVTVQRARDEAQALGWANDVRYGLASSVWSRDSARIARISRALDFGVVWANCHYVFTSEMPHGGFKESGHGQDLSLYALHAFTRIKHVMVAWGE
jgi:betaine-aldehyde dehydrogenase